MDMESCQEIKTLKEFKEVKEIERERSNRPLRRLIATMVIAIIVIGMGIGLPVHFIAKEKEALRTTSPNNMATGITTPSTHIHHHISTSTTVIPISGVIEISKNPVLYLVL